MKKFLVILTICISVFSITVFAADGVTFSDEIVKDVGNSWIYIIDKDNYKYLCKVKDGDIKKVGSDGITFNGNVTIYTDENTRGHFEKVTRDHVANSTSSGCTIYLSGVGVSHFNGVGASVSYEKVGNLNFLLPSLAAQQQGNLQTMIKGSSVTCSVILKVVLLGLAILLVVPLVVRVIRSFL